MRNSQIFSSSGYIGRRDLVERRIARGLMGAAIGGPVDAGFERGIVDGGRWLAPPPARTASGAADALDYPALSAPDLRARPGIRCLGDKRLSGSDSLLLAAASAASHPR